MITVAPAQTTGGVDITVGSAASATPPNVINLGANNICPASEACNTGDIVHRGSTAMLLMFGPGLTGDMQVSLDGPKDVTFGPLNPTTSTTGTSGLRISITVSPTAALGPRTLILRAPNGDITTFTGGLEVAP